MFENPGHKIKNWAIVALVLGIIGSIISGIGIMSVGSNSYYSDYSAGTVFTGLLVIVLGSLFSFLTSLFIYAAGTVVESVESIDARMASMTSLMHHQNDDIAALRKKVEEQIAANATPPFSRASGGASGGATDGAAYAAAQPSAKTGKPLPQNYVIVDRSHPSVVCPKCNTTQLSNRGACLNCGIAFIDSDELEKARQEEAAAGDAAPDNSDRHVKVDRTQLSLVCPLCGERQPSNLASCRRCKAVFEDTPV